jgi:hypothetical protein
VAWFGLSAGTNLSINRDRTLGVMRAVEYIGNFDSVSGHAIQHILRQYLEIIFGIYSLAIPAWFVTM